MIQALLIESVVKGVIEVGLDQLHEGSAGVQDLTPVIEALEGLNEHSEAILGALSRPTETAGAELCDRAATAYSNKWFDDALRDAEKSIETYPYSAKPRLIGGLAALALNRGETGLNHLISAVKYSANGQPDVGALAGVIAAHLADAVGGSKLALDVVTQADEITGRRCPAVVATIVRLTPDDTAALARLRKLWWTEHPVAGLTPSATAAKITSNIAAANAEYSPSGAAFAAYLGELGKVATSATWQLQTAKLARDALNTALEKPQLDSETRKALAVAANVRISWLDSLTPRAALKACHAKSGVVDRPAGPMPTVDDLARLRLYAGHTKTASAYLIQVFKDLPVIAKRDSITTANRLVIEKAIAKRNEWISVFTEIRKRSEALQSHKVYDAWAKLEGMIEPAEKEPVLHLTGFTTDVWKAMGALPAGPAPAKRAATRRARTSLPAKATGSD